MKHSWPDYRRHVAKLYYIIRFYANKQLPYSRSDKSYPPRHKAYRRYMKRLAKAYKGDAL